MGGAGLTDRVIPVRIGNSPVMKLARPAVQLASAVVVGEQHAFLGELVEIRRAPGHQANDDRHRCSTYRCRRP